MAIERRQVAAQLAQIKEAIDATQQVAAWNVAIEIERLEELVLAAALLTHHPDAPSVVMGSRPSEKDAYFFNRIGRLRVYANVSSSAGQRERQVLASGSEAARPAVDPSATLADLESRPESRLLLWVRPQPACPGCTQLRGSPQNG
jgi:nucleotide-binding universal stress UspA family protein